MDNKDFPKRKNIRLQKYDYSSNGLYFVTICTDNKKPILSTIVGDDAHIVPKRIVLKPYGEIVEKQMIFNSQDNPMNHTEQMRKSRWRNTT